MKHQDLKSTLRITLLITSCLGIVPFAQADIKNLAYVSNQDGAVTVVDLSTMESVGNFDIGAKGPRGIGVTADGNWLVTANKEDGNISVVDTSGTNVPKLVVIGKNPEFVRVMGDRAYVTYEPSAKSGPPPKPGAEVATKSDGKEEKIPGRIAIVDLKNGKVISEVIGKPETEGIEFSNDGKQMFVTNESDNSITVHDLSSGNLLKSIPLSKYGERRAASRPRPTAKRS